MCYKQYHCVALSDTYVHITMSLPQHMNVHLTVLQGDTSVRSGCNQETDRRIGGQVSVCKWFTDKRTHSLVIYVSSYVCMYVCCVLISWIFALFRPMRVTSEVLLSVVLYCAAGSPSCDLSTQTLTLGLTAARWRGLWPSWSDWKTPPLPLHWRLQLEGRWDERTVCVCAC